MSGDVAVRAQGLGKSYTRYSSRWAMLRDRLRGTTRLGEPHWALRGVGFEIQRGEMFGVIGRNGAGKSTLLQLLAGVLQPTEGTLEVRGKVLALLELGASFDPQSTGRDNTMVQLSLQGIPQADTAAMVERIQAFADIGEAFEEPVKSYSSGMFVRLAFAVNTVLEPDVLLVDEALAVGDVFFQQKCYRRLEELRRRGTTIVLVSHNLRDIQEKCSRVLVLDRGEAVCLASAYEGVHRYLAFDQPLAVAPLDAPAGGDGGWRLPKEAVACSRADLMEGYEGATLLGYQLADAEGRPVRRFAQGSTMQIHGYFQAQAPAEVAVAGFELEDTRNNPVHARNLLQYEPKPPALRPGDILHVRHDVVLDLAPGEYTVVLGLAAVDEAVFARRHLMGTGEMSHATSMRCRSRKLTAFTVELPEERRPARQAFHGFAQLPGEVRVGVVAGTRQ